MRRRRPFCRAVLVWAALGAAAGCRTPKQTPEIDLPAVRLDSAAGSGPASSPATTPATRPAAGPGTVGVDVTWAVIARVPDDALDPLDARATLVSAPLAGGPVLTSGRQTAAARFGDAAAVDRLLARLLARTDGPVAQVGHQVGVVSPGAITTFRFTADRADAKTIGRSVAVSLALPAADAVSPSTAPVTRPATAAAGPAAGTATVTLQGFVATAAADDDAGPATRPGVTTTPETAYLAGLSLAPGDRYALVLPCRFDKALWRGLVVLIDITAAPADALDLADAQLGRPPATGPGTRPAADRTLRRATDALRVAKDPRVSLLFLSTATRAAVAADTALVADAPTLDRLRTRVLQFTQDHDAADADALGWDLDRTAVLALCDAAQANTLSPELAAVLVLHGGEVGRHPDAMAEAAKGVGSAADLNARLIGENTIALEDNSPAARVRAYDWLKAQGRAPADYDPLGDARARRAAINRAISTTQGTR